MSELSFACRKDVVGVQSYIDEDEENEGPGRILTVEELIGRLRDRKDIFGIDRNDRLWKTEIIALIIAAVAIVWLSSNKPIQFKPEVVPSISDGEAADVTVERFEIDRTTARISSQEKHEPSTSVKMRRPPKSAIASMRTNTNGSGVGNVRSRITKVGIIGILTGQVRGKTAAGGEFFGNGGFASGIDAVLSGMTQGLKQGGSGPLVRRDVQCIGFGPGYGPSGFDGPNAGGIDEMINNLMISGESEATLTLKTGPPVEKNGVVAIPDTSGKISGDGRNKSEITRVVMQNIGALRYAYNRCLREKPGIKGKITIRFAIDEFGNVIHCEVVSSSIIDEELESTVTAKIMRWKFDRIDKPGDITEVVYPFVFST